MILKTVIKYKLFEWAIDAFLNGFSKLITNPLNKILLKNAIVGKRYRSLHIDSTCSLYKIIINDKLSNPNRLLIEYEYAEDHETNNIVFFAYNWDKDWYLDKLPSRLHENIYLTSFLHPKMMECYGVDAILRIEIPKDDFEYYYNDIEEILIGNFREVFIYDNDMTYLTAL